VRSRSERTTGGSPSHLAARFATLEVVQWLHIECPRAVEEKTSGGQFPLHLAAFQGSPDIVGFLADAFPQALRERAADGFLPLHNAAGSDAPLDVVYTLARLSPEAIVVHRGAAAAD
jgi:ankyrin repeat protein